ncbi:MAG: prolipoprotein diacylglyceryl transferase [Lachnospiraceae bacterium]|nr:prolipoprotein diacylglyceryl transferase [Lachnospiraceae bacterium]
MHVDLFSIGRFTVHSYGLLIAVGIILGVALAIARAKKLGLVGEEALNIAIIIVIFGFVGAKILFVLENFREFLEHPWSVLGSSGFVVYGGLVIGLFCVFVYCRWIRKIPFLRYVDLFFPFVALAQAFGRLGCFMAGCCYGKETTAWWGVVFPEGSFAPAGVPLIPTQLISATGDFVIFLVLFFYSRKAAKKVGDVAALYMLLYGIGRFFVEFLRQNEQGGIGPITTAQCFSFVFIGASVILFILNRKAGYSKNYADIFATINAEDEAGDAGSDANEQSDAETEADAESEAKAEDDASPPEDDEVPSGDIPEGEHNME